MQGYRMGFFDAVGKIPETIGDFIDSGWQYAALGLIILLALIFMIWKVFF